MAAGLLIPVIARPLQDRPKELELKRGLTEQISLDTTTAIRRGISFAFRHGDARPNSFFALRDNWLTRRAVLRSTIDAYFPAQEECWFLYSDAISDFLALARPDTETRNVADLQAFFAKRSDCIGYGSLPPYIRSRVRPMAPADWASISTGSRRKQPFLSAYEKLGGLLIVARDGMLHQIVAENARGFSHAPF